MSFLLRRRGKIISQINLLICDVSKIIRRFNFLKRRLIFKVYYLTEFIRRFAVIICCFGFVSALFI